MHQPYLEALKAFVEGAKDLKEWPQWWQENARLIEENEGRTRYLKVKLHWREGACRILDDHGIAYKPNPSVNWHRCRECGAPLFETIPYKTSADEIREWARQSNLPDEVKEAIERDGWIHPGVHCPNGCPSLLVTHRPD